MGVGEGGGGGQGCASPPPSFLTQMLGAPFAVKKGPPCLLKRKRLYSQLYEANVANKTIKGILQGPKRLCGVYLMVLGETKSISSLSGPTDPNFVKVEEIEMFIYYRKMNDLSRK